MPPVTTDETVYDLLCDIDEPHRTALLALREHVLVTATELDLPGGVVETLRWGQASYLPKKRGIGTTLRLARHDDQHVGLYVHCQTTLVEQFKECFGNSVQYSGNRAVLFPVTEPVPHDVVTECVRRTLQYHRPKDA